MSCLFNLFFRLETANVLLTDLALAEVLDLLLLGLLAMPQLDPGTQLLPHTLVWHADHLVIANTTSA